MTTFANRLYGNYLMPSRLQQYDELLGRAADAGYCQTSVRDFFRSIEDPRFAELKFVVHRHDIDSDLRTARKIFDIEKKYGVKSSFYFRLSTLDFKFMQEIDEYGSEASYHYEEIATFAKTNNIRNSGEVLRRLQEIRNDFVKNFEFIQDKFRGKLVTVASHGDFANRRLGISNTEILKDRDLREHCGIECESYDRALLDKFDVYISDRPYPGDFHPTSPFNAIGTKKKICVLTHPLQWETNWVETTKINFLRLYEGLVWRPID